MNLRSSPFLALVAAAACVFSGCASVSQSGVEGAASQVKVYGSDHFPAGQYEVVSRVWVDSWRTAYGLPTYPSEADAIAALQSEAGRLGADGLTNVFCLDQGYPKWSLSPGPAVLCYGNAIRIRRKEG